MDTTLGKRTPLGLFVGQPAPRLFDRIVAVIRTQTAGGNLEEMKDLSGIVLPTPRS